MPNRRRFLVQSTILALAPLAARSRSIDAAAPSLTFRPASFDVDTTSAIVWMRCDGDATLRVQWSPAEDWTRANLTAPVRLTQASDHTAAIELVDLQPGTRYRYRITDAEGQPRAGESASGEFRTAPPANRDFSFVFSADTHARHQPFTLFDRMRERQPDFFLHLGDTAYVDSPRSRFRETLDYFRLKHREIRRDPHLQRFLASCATFAMWDDHEVANDFTAAHPSISIGRQVFREYWPSRRIGGGATDPTVLYRRFNWTPSCEFHMLDTRQYRDAGDPAPDASGTLLGRRQLDWLLDGLQSSTAAFKFLCSPVPFHANGIDKWGGFKRERKVVVDFIRQRRIRNVVVLSADLHAAADLSSPRTGLVEFLVGPIAAPLQTVRSGRAPVRDAARAGSYVDDAYNFGWIRVRNRAGMPISLRHEVIDAANARRYLREIVADS